ncbi:LOW QUALITY PROTEIN: hypothetical protein HZS_7479 [Henneguya salminicola]|nr:LOW QUALITY PROTEIN: hypothetical protein HZS_7479 [Henneguya salminicola]
MRTNYYICLQKKSKLVVPNNVYFDATFKTVPQIFSQLFTVHATNFTTTFLSVEALMQQKKKAAYDTVWDSILRIININCNHAMCDFELESINSFNQRNPLCELTGCFFHLSTLYVKDHLFRKNIKNFLSHTFCPPGSILHCFESFENYLIENSQMDQIMEICNKFEDNFIGRLHRNIRQQPLFAINIWNQFTRIMGNVSRTNDVVERGRRGFSTLASASHLNFCKL